MGTTSKTKHDWTVAEREIEDERSLRGWYTLMPPLGSCLSESCAHKYAHADLRKEGSQSDGDGKVNVVLKG